MPSKNKPIVIVGGGFGGVQAALKLDHLLGHRLDAPIFLVDASPYHVYTPSLYEVANSHSPRVAAIPFEDIFEGTNVRFIQENVTSIDTELKCVTTERRQLPYEDLVIALGSQARTIRDDKANPDDVYSVKTINDVLKIRSHIQRCCKSAKEHSGDSCHTHFVIAGAGPTGVEFAASLAHYLKREAKQRGLPLKKIKITLADAGDSILGRLDPTVSRLAVKYLKSIGVSIRLKTKISWEDHERLRMNKDVVPVETLIWTAGVQPHVLMQKTKGLRQDERGNIIVDSSLQAVDAPRVWVVGDAAAVQDAGLALSAAAHGRHVAQSIKAVRCGDIAPAYQPKRWPSVIPLSDGYGIAKVGNNVFDGFWVILYKRYSDFRYYLSILPIPQAFELWTSRGKLTEQDGVFQIMPHLVKR